MEGWQRYPGTESAVRGRDSVAPGGAQHFLVLLLDDQFQLVARRSQVLAGIELGGVLREDFANLCREHQASIGVDVDLADGRAVRWAACPLLRGGGRIS